MAELIRIQPDAASMRAGIVVSRYHAWATDRLLEGALDRWRRFGGREEALIIAPASGTWELTAAARALSERGDLDGIVALGIVIRGETPHFDFICRGVTDGLTELTLRAGLPVGFGVLTCETRDQVEARAGGAIGNKGAEAMQAVIESVAAKRAVREFRFESDAGGKGKA